MWEVWAGTARDIGVLDLELGLEAGPEPEPEAVYSTALRRGSLAGTRNAMLLFRQLNRRPAGDPGGIKKPVSRDAYSLLHCTSLSTVRLNSCVKSALRIILFALDALSRSYHSSVGSDSIYICI